MNLGLPGMLALLRWAPISGNPTCKWLPIQAPLGRGLGFGTGLLRLGLGNKTKAPQTKHDTCGFWKERWLKIMGNQPLEL